LVDAFGGAFVVAGTAQCACLQCHQSITMHSSDGLPASTGRRRVMAGRCRSGSRGSGGSARR
jgi:hypothetical protein